MTLLHRSLEIPCAAQGFAFTTQHKILLFILGFAAVNLRSKIWTELSCLCSRVTHPPLPCLFYVIFLTTVLATPLLYVLVP
ncbi:hypothetical protein B0H10DRAFT_942074 [Mycena sp. CBHHK59/15]|nr:hypothetical protein B0H10DRAFT_942074 [Mycena sp. CBHHK59/15]